MPGLVAKRSRHNEANTAKELIVLFLQMCKHKKLDCKTGPAKETSIHLELKWRLLVKKTYYIVFLLRLQNRLHEIGQSQLSYSGEDFEEISFFEMKLASFHPGFHFKA